MGARIVITQNRESVNPIWEGNSTNLLTNGSKSNTIFVEVQIRMDLGEYLIQARNARGMSQRDLAEKSGVSPAEISRVESGKRQNASPAVLRALADTLVISYPYLLQLAGYMDDPAPEEPQVEGVFKDEETGEMVDLPKGARQMMQTDALWANVAYRVSRELSENDRRILTDQAMAFLNRKRDGR